MKIKEVETKDKTNIEFLCRTKRKTKGFHFKSPEWLMPSFQKDVSQFKVGLDHGIRFIRYCNAKIHTRLKNMGDC